MLSNRVLNALRPALRTPAILRPRMCLSTARAAPRPMMFSPTSATNSRYAGLLSKYAPCAGSDRGFVTAAKLPKMPKSGVRKNKINIPETDTAAELQRVKSYRRGGVAMGFVVLCFFVPGLSLNIVRAYRAMKIRDEGTVQYKGAYNNIGNWDDLLDDLSRRYKTKTKFRVLKDPALHKVNQEAVKSRYCEGSFNDGHTMDVSKGVQGNMDKRT